jgi:hypothetical protein
MLACNVDYILGDISILLRQMRGFMKSDKT